MPQSESLIPPEARTWLAGADLSVKGSYCVDEIATLLGVSRSTVYDMITRGDLPCLRTAADGTRRSPTRIPISAIVALLDL